MKESITEQAVEQPVEQFAEQPVPPKKSKKGLLIGIVAAVVVVAVSLVLLLTGGVNMNELMAGRVFETYLYIEDSNDWFYILLTFDETGENYSTEFYQYENQTNTATLSTSNSTDVCAFEKIDKNVYMMSDFEIVLSENGEIASVTQKLETLELEFEAVEASSVGEYLEDQAIEILSNYRVVSFANYTYSQVIPQVFKDYQLVCTPVSNTQYRITMTGAYYPFKTDLPSFVQEGGKLTCLVDIETKEVTIEESVGIETTMIAYVYSRL